MVQPDKATFPRKTLAVELLRKLLNNEIRTRWRRNVVRKSRLFFRVAGGRPYEVPEPGHPCGSGHRGTAGSSETFTSSFPVLVPSNSLFSAAGAARKPSTMSMRYLSLPSCSHPIILAAASGNRDA